MAQVYHELKSAGTQSTVKPCHLSPWTERLTFTKELSAFKSKPQLKSATDRIQKKPFKEKFFGQMRRRLSSD